MVLLIFVVLQDRVDKLEEKVENRDELQRRRYLESMKSMSAEHLPAHLMSD